MPDAAAAMRNSGANFITAFVRRRPIGLASIGLGRTAWRRGLCYRRVENEGFGFTHRIVWRWLHSADHRRFERLTEARVQQRPGQLFDAAWV
jgi:hypothetical protein